MRGSTFKMRSPQRAVDMRYNVRRSADQRVTLESKDGELLGLIRRMKKVQTVSISAEREILDADSWDRGSFTPSK